MTLATYHLWLKPNGAVRGLLVQTIQKLADELGSPVFEPHVTLLANLIGTEEEHIQRSRIAAQQLQSFEVMLIDPAHDTTYFQCLFLRIEQTPSLMNAHTVARRVFEKPAEIYMPHLSLAYGLYAESLKRNIICDLPSDLRTSFEVTALSLLKAESDDPRDWHQIGSYPFAG